MFFPHSLIALVVLSLANAVHTLPLTVQTDNGETTVDGGDVRNGPSSLSCSSTMCTHSITDPSNTQAQSSRPLMPAVRGLRLLSRRRSLSPTLSTRTDDSIDSLDTPPSRRALLEPTGSQEKLSPPSMSSTISLMKELDRRAPSSAPSDDSDVVVWRGRTSTPAQQDTVPETDGGEEIVYESERRTSTPPHQDTVPGPPSSPSPASREA